MDNKIAELLKTYHISDIEIQDMLNIAPLLEDISFDEFITNIGLLVQYGYPKTDLDFLFLANPNIFVLTKEDLEKELMGLKEKYRDIELVLKNNPTII